MFDLSGKTAMVTGAGRGIGAGIAVALAGQGARVVINDYFPERAEAKAEELRRDGYESIGLGFDVSDNAQVNAGVSDAEKQLGAIDILVNNVGTLPHGMMPEPFKNTTEAQWLEQINNNLLSTLNCSHRVLGGMSERGWGRVVAISSDAGRLGHYGSAAYGAAKAGMDGLMRTLAKEYGSKGITANSIALGLIDTVPAEFAVGAEKYYSTGRIGTPADVGAAAVYLSSNEAGWVSGHTLVVNGGFLGA